MQKVSKTFLFLSTSKEKISNKGDSESRLKQSNTYTPNISSRTFKENSDISGDFLLARFDDKNSIFQQLSNCLK